MTAAEIIEAYAQKLITKQEARESLGFASTVDEDPTENAPIPNTTPAPQQAPQQFVPVQVIPQQQQPVPVCPVHGGSRHVPGGVSKSKGVPYHCFLACSTTREVGCSWKADCTVHQ